MVDADTLSKVGLSLPDWPIGYILARRAIISTDFVVLRLFARTDLGESDCSTTGYSGISIYVIPYNGIDQKACPEMRFSLVKLERGNVVRFKDIVPGGYGLSYIDLYKHFSEKSDLCGYLSRKIDIFRNEISCPRGPTNSEMVDFLNSLPENVA